MIRAAVRDGKPVVEISGPAVQRLLDLIYEQYLQDNSSAAEGASSAPDDAAQEAAQS